MLLLWLGLLLFFTEQVAACHCEFGWLYNVRTNFCYHTANHPLRWHEAENFCQSKNSHLVSINSNQERMFVEDMIDHEFFSWVGLSRSQDNSDFTWSDGSSVNYTLFEKTQFEVGDCVAWAIFENQNGWKVISCNYSQFFVCKKRAPCQTPVILNSSKDDFRSDGYPFGYPNDDYKILLIEVEPLASIAIRVEDFDTEEDDVLTMYDGTTAHAPVLAKLRGSFHNITFLSSTNTILLIFKTDNAIHGRGFHISYEVYKKNDIIYKNETSGVLLSPGYPNYFPMFVLQEYMITCYPEYHVHFKLTNLSISSNDYLRFFDGPNENYSIFQEFSKHAFKKYTYFFRSSSKIVFVKFNSSENSTRSTGWELHYDCVRIDGMGSEIII